MTELVVDASVATKWFRDEQEEHRAAARELLARYLAGELVLAAPPLFYLELLNAAARRWRWPADRLDQLADRLDRLGFIVRQPSLSAIARWTSRGLTAYDACYVALAEERGVQLVTSDELIISVGGTRIRSLSTQPES